MKYYIVDAFTSEPFGGNTAGVVLLDGDFPSDKLMLHVAAELRYSETAFVRHDGPAEFTLRYFTPAAEVDLCGHATVASFGLLLREGLVADGDLCLNHTLAGDLKVKAGERVMMQMAAPRLLELPLDIDRLHRIIAGDSQPQWPDGPIEVISTGLPDIILPVESISDLNALSPNMDALARLSRELDVVGVHAFALADDGYCAHVRNFAPRYDIPEESATGTANAALTHYLTRRGLVKRGQDCRFMQGEVMGHPSVVATTLDEGGSIWVGGQCCIVARGDLLV